MSELEIIKLTEDGKVTKKILQQGQGEETPQNGQEVFVTYIGTLTDGSRFDANENKESPFKFTIGVGQVIKGWDVGMATMKRGERSLFTIDHEYAYGESGQGSIPAKATLNFEVEMLDFKDKEKDKWDCSLEERIQKGIEFKNKGNDEFKQSNFIAARKQYEEAFDWLDTGSDDNEQQNQLKINVANNLAAVYIKLRDWTKAIEKSDIVLKEDANNVKALFRRGQSKSELGLLEEAKSDFQVILQQEPDNAAAKKELATVNQRLKKSVQKEKKIWGQMFSQTYYEESIVSGDDPSNPSNPRVFFLVQIGDQEPQRLEFELFQNVVPKTTENFKQLCKTHYKGTIFHRLIKGFMIQGGDYENRNGTGGKSIYGEKFEDENFKIKHTKKGLLSMANAGKNTNGSQFFLTFKETPWLDDKHVVFGQLISNFEFLDTLENSPTDGEKPKEEIKVIDAGEIVQEQEKKE